MTRGRLRRPGDDPTPHLVAVSRLHAAVRAGDETETRTAVRAICPAWRIAAEGV